MTTIFDQARARIAGFSGHFIDGGWTQGGGETIKVADPATAA